MNFIVRRLPANGKPAESFDVSSDSTHEAVKAITKVRPIWVRGSSLGSWPVVYMTVRGTKVTEYHVFQRDGS